MILARRRLSWDVGGPVRPARLGVMSEHIWYVPPIQQGEC